jgi:hypothetical protein
MKKKNKTPFQIEYREGLIDKDYVGMNFEAAHEKGLPFHHRHKRTLEIDRKQSHRQRCITIRHEEIEYTLMNKYHFPYKHAHKIALIHEADKMPIHEIVAGIKL